jgi:hypothetical protein
MSFQIPVNLVRPDDVIHREGQDWRVIIKRYIYIYEPPPISLLVQSVTNVREQHYWLFDDPDEVVQIHDRV